MIEFDLPDAAREDLAEFAARVVRLDPATVVRLRRLAGPATEPWVRAWAQTPFGVLATRAVPGTVTPTDLSVVGSQLLAGLAVSRAARIDPGARADAQWRAALPPDDGWTAVAEVPGEQIDALAERGLRLVGEPAGSLDEIALTAGAGTAGAGTAVPMRCLVALSGMGWLGGPDPIRVAATPSWVRLDAALGAVVCRRHAQLPLVGVG